MVTRGLQRTSIHHSRTRVSKRGCGVSGGTLPAVSQHLAKLKLAGLVHSRREGRRQVYLVDDERVVTAVRLMVDQPAVADGPTASGTGARGRAV